MEETSRRDGMNEEKEGSLGRERFGLELLIVADGLAPSFAAPPPRRPLVAPARRTPRRIPSLGPSLVAPRPTLQLIPRSPSRPVHPRARHSRPRLASVSEGNPEPVRGGNGRVARKEPNNVVDTHGVAPALRVSDTLVGASPRVRWVGVVSAPSTRGPRGNKGRRGPEPGGRGTVVGRKTEGTVGRKETRVWCHDLTVF